MELFELKSEDRILKVFHKILLITGILTIIYLLKKLFEKYFDKKANNTPR